MTLLPALVLAAIAPAASGGPLQDFLAGPIGSMAPLFLMVAAAYFLLIRPQTQRAKQHQATVSAVKRGDTVVLSSGILGKVVRVEDVEVGVEIAQNVTIKVIKSMISEVRTRGEPAAANDSKS